jgi:hypothetical protein
MASVDVAIGRATGRRRVYELLERDGLLVAVVGVYVAALVVRLPWFVNQDTWYTLVGGREVLHHGLPGTDTLTYWTAGKQWINQQWLAQAFSYGVFSLGGLKLLALLNTGLIALALAFSIHVARRRGAGPRATALVVVCVATLLFLVSSQVRAQTLAYPLFALVLMLLLRDSRAPGRSVFLVLPILALWANLHGSVVLGTLLVTVRAAVVLLDRTSTREARAKYCLLLSASVLAVFATPWGLRIVDYYRDTLFNSSFKLIIEWRAPSLSIATAPLFLLAGAAVWLLGRYHRQFTAFERLTLVLLVAFALGSLRNVAWLALGAIPLLAPVVENLVTGMRPAPPRTTALLGMCAGGVALIAVASAALRPGVWFAEQFPASASGAIASAAGRDPSLKIFANERYSDWLLFTHPSLKGRIAYDIRFELLTKAQVKSIVRWRSEITDDWRRAAAGARLIVLDPRTEWRNERRLLDVPGVRRIYRDTHISVLLRPQIPQSS